jgi:large subunit ribosomal protein L23
MKPYYKVLISKINSETADKRYELFNQYTFKVHKDANKIDIAKAVMSAFNLEKNEILAVNTMICPGKWRRVGRYGGGYRPDWKKATVTLVKGAHIDVFDIVEAKAGEETTKAENETQEES